MGGGTGSCCDMRFFNLQAVVFHSSGCGEHYPVEVNMQPANDRKLDRSYQRQQIADDNDTIAKQMECKLTNIWNGTIYAL